jgi:NADPH2:quinone reductase
MADRRVQAMVVERPGEPDGMQLAELDARAVAANQVRVRLEAAGVNPVDASNRADPGWAGLRPPFVVGYEFAGRVSEVGDQVDDLAAGDAVWGLLDVRGTRWGAYAEEVVCEARLVAARPPELEPAEAATLPLAGVTAMQLLDRLGPAPGEWMLLHGAAGGVGHLLCQLARSRGVNVAAPARPERHPLLRRLGVGVVVDRGQRDAMRAARDLAGVDFAVVADTVGHGCLAASLEVAAEGARLGSIVELAADLDQVIDRNMTLVGVLVRPGREALDALAVEVCEHGLRPLVDELLPLRDAARAHQRVESGSGQGKVALVVGG